MLNIVSLHYLWLIVNFAYQIFACDVCDKLSHTNTISSPSLHNSLHHSSSPFHFSLYDDPTNDDDIILTRLVRRSQPGSPQLSHPSIRRYLEWGDVNFLHTTDTHGWLAGHLREPLYSADWGDFASFTQHMRAIARNLSVDLLLIDTGDLHDGAGIFDKLTPNGALALPIWESIDYDLLTIGNHELYVADISYLHFNQFYKHFGDRYVNSNVKIFNPNTQNMEQLGAQYRYWTTEQGVRIMAFGVLFDFDRNSNVTQITKAEDMIVEQWFIDAVNINKPVDLYLIIGHNPVDPNDPQNTLKTVVSAIRKYRPTTPIQVFGGHNHIRDFKVYDRRTTALSSGRFCETLGWLAIKGLNTSRAFGDPTKFGFAVPTHSTNVIHPAYVDTVDSSDDDGTLGNDEHEPVDLAYSRRYMDWNRQTFEFHSSLAVSQLDTEEGKNVTARIYQLRRNLNLSDVLGCAPQTWCRNCQELFHPDSVYTLLRNALKSVIFNKLRENTPRLIFTNTGIIRFSLFKGIFMEDDNYSVLPFKNSVKFIPNVKYEYARQIEDIINSHNVQIKRSINPSILSPSGRSMTHECLDPVMPYAETLVNNSSVHLTTRSTIFSKRTRYPRIILRQEEEITPGYHTVDDFGDDGDDVRHTAIPYIEHPLLMHAEAGFPNNPNDTQVSVESSNPPSSQLVDVVFAAYVQSWILRALQHLGQNYTDADVQYYMPQDWTTAQLLPDYVRRQSVWQRDIKNCTSW